MSNSIAFSLGEMMSHNLGWAMLAAMSVYFLSMVYTFINTVRRAKGLKCIPSLFEYFEAMYRTMTPNVPGIFPRAAFDFDNPWNKYAKARSDLIAAPQLLTPYAVYCVGSAVTANDVLNRPQHFGKPVESLGYRFIALFGNQIVSAQTGADHRRHRGVVKGCFGEEINKAVWANSVKGVEMMMESEGILEGGILPDVCDAMMRVTLMVIGTTGFGVSFPYSFQTDSREKNLTFHEALRSVIDNFVTNMILPLNLMLWSPVKSLRQVGQGQAALRKHFERMIHEKRAQLEATGAKDLKVSSDLLGALVASQIEVEKQEGQGLSFSDIVGNVFIFILAGHETSGHTLAFAIGFLATHPEWQKAVYEEIVSVCGDEPPTFHNFAQLQVTLATLYETLRMRDLVRSVPRIAFEDTTLPYTTWDEDGKITHHVHHVRKGDHIVHDLAAFAENPFHWPKPEIFDPARFLGEQGIKNRALHGGWSAGVRGCLGKRFSEVEMVAVLATLCHTFKFEPVRLDGESDEMMRDRVTRGEDLLTLTPGEWSLKCVKR